MTKSAGNCRFGYNYWRNSWWKTSFFVQRIGDCFWKDRCKNIYQILSSIQWDYELQPLMGVGGNLRNGCFLVLNYNVWTRVCSLGILYLNETFHLWVLSFAPKKSLHLWISMGTQILSETFFKIRFVKRPKTRLGSAF